MEFSIVNLQKKLRLHDTITTTLFGVTYTGNITSITLDGFTFKIGDTDIFTSWADFVRTHVKI